MKIISFAGLALNDITNFEAFFVDDPLPYGLPPAMPITLNRSGRWPRVSGVQRNDLVRQMVIYVRGGSTAALSASLNYEDETVKTLIVADQNGSNPRYWEVICQALREVPRSAGKKYIAAFKIDGDPRLRFVTESSDTWAIGATGATRVIANTGQDEAYPKYRLVPAAYKSVGYSKKRWIKCKWRNSASVVDHPVDICAAGFDTAAEISGGDMQADGDDLRVWVDGAQVNRWLSGLNTTSTKVWVNLDFRPQQITKLKTAIAGAGAVSTIEAQSDIAEFPSTGLLEIDSEIFVYAGKSDAERKFTGVTRAQRGSSAAAHAVDKDVEWIQHDIYILYANPAATAPAVDDTKKPIFDLATSNNGSWVYADFGSADPRTGQWTFHSLINAEKYTADKNTDGEPWSEMGIRTYDGFGYWAIIHPGLISNVNFQSGERYLQDLATPWAAGILSFTPGQAATLEDVIAKPTTAGSWASWSDNEAISPARAGVAFFLNAQGFGSQDNVLHALEVSSVTITITTTPGITIGSEDTNYDLDCVLTNETTNESIRVNYPFLDTGQIVEIDTYNRTVRRIYTGTNYNIYPALTLREGPRKNWLKLRVGNNTLRFDEDGLNGVTLTTTFARRNYE